MYDENMNSSLLISSSGRRIVNKERDENAAEF